MTLFLATRNLVLQRRRYALIALAVLLGFSLITVISGAAYGALETVKSKAARYFAGHVSVTGYYRGAPSMSDPDAVLETLAAAKLPVRTMARRTVYYKTDAELFFGGETVRQRRLVGIDFSAERDELANLRFSDGSIDAMLGDDGRDGILISESAANLLGARVGDDVILYLTTDAYQYNTATMLVRGVFSETSLFGYVAYVRNEDLNRLLLRDPTAASDIALYAAPGHDYNELAESVRLALSSRHAVFPTLPTKDTLYAELAKGNSEETLAVFSLDAHLAQIKSILTAFIIVAYFVLGVFVLVVMVGILNTYRVIVYERTREIGTMRALGMSSGAVSRLFVVEALGLALLSSAGGLVAALVLFKLAGFIDLSSVPSAGLFTERGRLRFYIDARIMTLNLAIMVGGVVLAALGPARKASLIHPADAMRDEA